MRDEGVIYVAGHPLLNRRCARLPGCFHFPKRKLQLLKARHSFIVLKVPLKSNQSVDHISTESSVCVCALAYSRLIRYATQFYASSRTWRLAWTTQLLPASAAADSPSPVSINATSITVTRRTRPAPSPPFPSR